MEEVITAMRDVAIRANLPKESFAMFTFALAKSCFVKYMLDIEPVTERGEKPRKMTNLSKEEWLELVKSNDFTNLKKKIIETVRDQKKLFYQYYNTIKNDFAQRKIKLTSFMEILNDNLDDMDKAKVFIKTMGKNIIDFFHSKFGNGPREMKFCAKLIHVIQDLQKETLPVFDIALRTQEVESMKSPEIMEFIAKFQES